MQPERLLGIAATIVIIAAIIAGLVLIEGPGTARADRFDRERTANLNALAQLIDEHYRMNGTMPGDLEPFTEEYNFDRTSTDPRTGETYAYEPLGGNSYRLCATFETEGPHELFSQMRPMLDRPGYERHVSPTAVEGSGRQCFEITMLPETK